MTTQQQVERVPVIKRVEELISKAAAAGKADDAMKFAQAAQNAAAALCGLVSAEKNSKD